MAGGAAGGAAGGGSDEAHVVWRRPNRSGCDGLVGWSVLALMVWSNDVDHVLIP